MLGADLLVEGSFRREGGGLRVSARLVDAQTGYQVWSGVFERPAADLFALQEEIARAIAQALHMEQPADAAKRGVSARGYELYLQGRFHWNRRPGPPVWQGLRCFEQALESEPGYAAAWAGIADVYATLGSWESGVLPPEEAREKTRACTQRALEIDPDLAEAHTTLAYSALHHDCDLPGAERAFRRALQLSPSYATAHHWYSHYLVAAGRFAEALREFDSPWSSIRSMCSRTCT